MLGGWGYANLGPRLFLGVGSQPWSVGDLLTIIMVINPHKSWDDPPTTYFPGEGSGEDFENNSGLRG